MYPTIQIFGREIATYALFAAAGILAVLAWLFAASSRRKLPPENAVITGLVSCIGVFLGGHVLYTLTNLPNMILAFSHYNAFPDFWTFIQHLLSLMGGMVFYGGLLGGIAAAWVYMRIAKLNIPAYADLFAPAVPLFHIFGRVGCFFGGCCYGIEWPGGFVYTHAPIPEANGVARLPVQLIEAGWNLLLFLALACLLYKGLCRGILFYVYLFCYAPARFILEFFRGDTLRGIWFGLSTSQWISLLLILAAVFGLWRRAYRLKKQQYNKAE